MWPSTSKGLKLKPLLKMAVSRLQIASNKKSALLKQQKREVAILLDAKPPREDKARISAESCIREENTIMAYELLQMACEQLVERARLLENMKECPPDFISIVSTLIWASYRVEIGELSTIRMRLREKYGKEFEQNAMNNVGGVLNPRIVAMLSNSPVAPKLVENSLVQICEKEEVDWKPTPQFPASAPNGYSVQAFEHPKRLDDFN
eukprot:CAMPEP_0194029238 /NCGR_PEP_ID=MMETSP0009_2-20130614/3025_1 /TAXON_ID=210454 /ORGANISM="Grammatophora oceanica, Strain CCMP 410" /LENGTH=206 /DNA_ID=CAMNT_0038668849 /DNA_START=121 /DNA_END=739 /DNA_ORIENTATION=-